MSVATKRGVSRAQSSSYCKCADPSIRYTHYYRILSCKLYNLTHMVPAKLVSMRLV